MRADHALWRRTIFAPSRNCRPGSLSFLWNSCCLSIWPKISPSDIVSIAIVSPMSHFQLGIKARRCACMLLHTPVHVRHCQSATTRTDDELNRRPSRFTASRQQRCQRCTMPDSARPLISAATEPKMSSKFSIKRRAFRTPQPKSSPRE